MNFHIVASSETLHFPDLVYLDFKIDPFFYFLDFLYFDSRMKIWPSVYIAKNFIVYQIAGVLPFALSVDIAMLHCNGCS